MRDGEYVGMRNMSEVTIDEIITMMVGREIYEEVHDLEREQSSDIILEVKNLTRGKKVKDVSFQLRRGEILGFAGLMGAGRTEVARCLFGADAKDSGDIFIKGKKVNIRSPKDAVANGIGYLSEDRKRYGLVLGLDVNTNIAMATMPRFSNQFGFLKEDQEVVNASKYIEALDIKTPSGKQLVKISQEETNKKWLLKMVKRENCDVLS